MQGVGYRPERFGVTCVPPSATKRCHGIAALCEGCAAYGHKVLPTFQVLSHSIADFRPRQPPSVPADFRVQVVTNGEATRMAKC